MNLTPKSIIIETLKSKLKGTGIIKITLVFFLESEKYNIMLMNETGDNLKMDVDKNDINTIKKLFINRVVTAWNKKYDIEPCSVIVSVDLLNESFQIFIQDEKQNVHKFEF